MALFDRLKDAMSQSNEDAIDYQFHCQECGTDFTDASASVTRVTCPSCDAAGARSLSKL